LLRRAADAVGSTRSDLRRYAVVLVLTAVTCVYGVWSTQRIARAQKVGRSVVTLAKLLDRTPSG